MGIILKNVNITGGKLTTSLPTPSCPNTNIEVNGASEGSVVAGSTVDVQLSDSGGTVTPDSVTLVGTDLQIVLADAPPAECIDSDAQRFLEATAITDVTIEDALDTFVKGLKNDGIWYKMDFIYPFLGGTATTTKFNLINPIDSDSAFRITWSGGVDFTNGMLSNGTNGYGNTHFNPATQAGNNNTSIGYKCTTDLFASAMEMGAFNSQKRFAIFNFGDVQYVDMYGFNAGSGRVNSSQGDTRGVYVGSRTASNILKLYRNGSKIGITSTGVENNVADIPFNIYIGALNNGGTPQFFCPRNLTFAFSGRGLSDTDVANLTTLINNFDTAIGR